MAIGKILFLSVYAVVFIGVFFAIYFLSSLHFDRLDDPDPVFQLDILCCEANSTRFTAIGNRIYGESVVSDAYIRNVFESPPLEEGMPPIETFKLTKELVATRAKDNVIIITFGNNAFKDIIMNWAMHLVAINVSSFLVGAMDIKLLEALYWKGVPVFDMGRNTTVEDLGWGTRAFQKMGRDKINLLNSFLPLGFEVLLCDTDTVWIKNPLPYLAQFPEADILVSSDRTVPTSTDDYLDKGTEVYDSYNIGLFHWRPTKPALKFAKEWYKSLVADDKLWDQDAFNMLLREGLGWPAGGDGNLVYAYNQSIKLGLLSTSIFCSGHTFFVQKMPQQLYLEAYAVHTTFQYGGFNGKRHRLREALLFYDPPEYFQSPGGFLAFKPRIPGRLLVEGPHTVQSHFALINYQLKQIRTAFAIASLLNRTLVMPPLWCRWDRLWYGHRGVIANSLTMQPFLCPMDHVLEVDLMLANHPEDRFGPKIEFREYSFLRNPALPKQTKESQLHVQLCEEKYAGCNVTAPGLLRLPKNLDEHTLIKVLLPYKDVKILEFSSMDRAFKGFTDKEREKKFRRRVSKYTSIFCCVEGLKIGHIYYDMFWDEKPDWKPVPPETSADDTPPWITD